MFCLGDDSTVYYLSRTSTDLRKGFDALCAEVRSNIGRDTYSQEVFIFYNSSRTRLKLLRYERGGLVLSHKRLDRGILTLPAFDCSFGGFRITWRQLVLMVEGGAAKDTLSAQTRMTACREWGACRRKWSFCRIGTCGFLYRLFA